MAEIIYLLTNEAMPTYVKIGRTSDSVEARISSLSSHSGVPLPFECYFAAEVENCVKLEKQLHQLFSEYRVHPNREFFFVDPEKVVLAISIGNFKVVTPGGDILDDLEQHALDKAKSRRGRINLEALDIHPGTILTFSRDKEIIGKVVEGNKIQLKDEILSLSAAALKVLHSMGYKTPSASGSEYWMLGDELIDERRRRMETEQFDLALDTGT